MYGRTHQRRDRLDFEPLAKDAIAAHHVEVGSEALGRRGALCESRQRRHAAALKLIAKRDARPVRAEAPRRLRKEWGHTPRESDILRHTFAQDCGDGRTDACRAVVQRGLPPLQRKPPPHTLKQTVSIVRYDLHPPASRRAEPLQVSGGEGVTPDDLGN
ncbi:hypothetical protein EMIHUDRAFT_370678 [Emiliania huxleyi CCMP1516]|uniref:Uncharacterized protein n=2 Tax=Emiliania huxleyi TaxID=2903 RepID=A0A0D3IVH1_EMIH1|nr:hypothetical protein EMIHUDRAFT_370678 [Emiliania huxleyi CCMP1516]EOD15256.1 hypothetical protein EMIHUDRAFT_370678 [Emiliania huxleyi CCMP1516]|eukprot:XP_005767685.1 hypothetical protein EMIHUDRAFT_370678 [Emiliania huxleyi CCMP1516]